ncbi:hypothetical protein MUK66_gp21 [Bacillus phage Aurora]|uniref:Uncharacterized protein n=1 Tax=Bacillus phage Aurora TaxID=1874000 RepID=A0A1B1PAF2_9CAUD|nr:hypothetical protein MUK66_gp21 [Bacillus phage Aurora]ANT41135.1 hypothetical protein AURORA_21 [Bacillus phage Aurora]
MIHYTFVYQAYFIHKDGEIELLGTYGNPDTMVGDIALLTLDYKSGKLEYRVVPVIGEMIIK